MYLKLYFQRKRARLISATQLAALLVSAGQSGVQHGSRYVTCVGLSKGGEWRGQKPYYSRDRVALVSCSCPLLILDPRNTRIVPCKVYLSNGFKFVLPEMVSSCN